ncbi:MAG: hypothetical protein V4819_21750 [Verrucomicrobiota bacterium]
MKQLAFTEADSVDPRFEELNRWTFLMMQVFEARTFLDLAESTHHVHPLSSLSEVLTQQALFRSFILSYGKCFVSSGTGRSSLDPKKIYLSLSAKLDTHQRLLELRHKFAAHNDCSGLDEAVIEVVESPSEFEVSHLYSVANPLHEYPSYRELLQTLEDYIVVGTNKHLDSLQRRLGKTVLVKK